MKNSKVYIKNSQPYIVPVRLVDGSWVGYVEGNIAITPTATATPTPTVTPTPTTSFTPIAVLLTSGTSYTVPNGATTMKAWGIGGARYSSGAVVYKTWAVTGGTTVAYSCGRKGTWLNGGQTDTTITYSGTTITAQCPRASSKYDDGVARPLNGDGGSIGVGTSSPPGAIGGTPQTIAPSGQRLFTQDVGGLQSVLTRLSINYSTPGSGTFGASAMTGKYTYIQPGYGGSAANANYYGGNSIDGGAGCVVLYFT
jgi:hypothetical protein